MDVQSEAAKVVLEHGRSVVERCRQERAVREQVVAEARAERRRGRNLCDEAVAARDRNLDLTWRLWTALAVPSPPSTIPLSWGHAGDPEAQLDRAVTAAEECADACVAALRGVDGMSHGALASIAGACSLAAERGRSSHLHARMAMGLCVRVIEANSAILDRIGEAPGGVLAASAARRCMQSGLRALAASYARRED